MGPEQELLAENTVGLFRGLPTPSIQHRRFDFEHRLRFIDAYSAAARTEGFVFAANSMKSEMRGTISDLNREPLKTP
jgi:hypothetical protein